MTADAAALRRQPWRCARAELWRVLGCEAVTNSCGPDTPGGWSGPRQSQVRGGLAQRLRERAEGHIRRRRVRREHANQRHEAPLRHLSDKRRHKDAQHEGGEERGGFHRFTLLRRTPCRIRARSRPCRRGPPGARGARTLAPARCPNTCVHTRGAPLPLSPSALAAGARAPRHPSSSRRRAHRTPRLGRCTRACHLRARPWGPGGLGHPSSPPPLSGGCMERSQRRVTAPPVSAMGWDAASCAVTCARHGGRARRPPAPTTPAGRGAVGCAAVPSSPPPALDTPEGSTWAQTTAAWCRAGR